MARFCLVPAGTSPWTNHLYEAFFAGCIPVVLSDALALPFPEEIAWPQVAIRWPEAAANASLIASRRPVERRGQDGDRGVPVVRAGRVGGVDDGAAHHGRDLRDALAERHSQQSEEPAR